MIEALKNILKPAFLVLEDGNVYRGWSLEGDTISLGEVVFNTGMTGYQEIITDPSYHGQIIVFTYPELGNTGINREDNESSVIHIKGIITKHLCFKPSNWRSHMSFAEYIKMHNIPHIFGIDTRSLTKHLRDYGAMNGCISSSILSYKHIKDKVDSTPNMEGYNLVDRVTTKQTYKLSIFKQPYRIYSYYNKDYCEFEKRNTKPYRIIVLDLGVKQNVINKLLKYNCDVYVLPATSDRNTIVSQGPDGILLSNGPGDPQTMKKIIHNIRQIITEENIPIFGICMGHQILSLALGGQTFKLKFGHRGLNHPTGIGNKAEITSQNHGFAVKAESLCNSSIHITHLNLNDRTVAGMIHKSKPIFSVQYHPEASPGPHDSDYFFKYFINTIKFINKAKTKI